MQEIGLDAADDLIAALADRLRSALGARRRRRALRRTPVRGALAATATTSAPSRSPNACARRFADHVFEVGARSLSRDGEHRRRADRREDRLGHAGARQGQPGRAVVGGRRRQSRGDLRSGRGGSRRGRTRARVGRTHPRGGGRRRLRAALPAGHQPARRSGRNLRSAAAPARRVRRRARAAADVPADRGGTRVAVGDRPLGRRPRDPGRSPNARASARTPRCWSRSRRPRWATTRWRSSSASSSPRTRCRATAWCCSCRSRRCSRTSSRRRPSARR